MEKMLAAVLHDFDKLELEQVPVPRTREYGDVLVRIRACGICATDYKAIKGIRRNVTFPAIVGHEPSGVVAEACPERPVRRSLGEGGSRRAGPGVSHFRAGDEVIVQPLAHCGICRHCRAGNTHYCENAFVTGGDGPQDVRAGAFAEFMLTRETSLFRKPAAISFDAAALTEPLAGAWKGVIQYSQMQIGDDVVIIGAGSMGLLCLMVAKAAGAARLIAVDPSEHALKRARELGATHTVNPTEGDAKRQVYEIIPEGPDLVVEAAGPVEAVRLMVELRRRGTKWNVFGITTHETFELNGGLTHFLEGRMDASFGTTPLAMTKAIRLMETGLVDTEKIITHRFPLTRIHEAIGLMASQERTKIIVNP